MEGLDKKIIETNPILESFGTRRPPATRTPRASRFGKFMKLQFNEKGKARNLLAGGMIERRSCSRSRAWSSFQMKGERNYHVFYQLFTGCSDAQKAEWRLDDPEKFNYLNQSGCVKVEQIDDKAEFADLDAAILKCIPEGGAEKKGTLLQILAGLLTNTSYTSPSRTSPSCPTNPSRTSPFCITTTTATTTTTTTTTTTN